MVFIKSVFQRAVASSVAAATLALSPLAEAARAITLNGAGASFPAPLYQLYAREIKKKHSDITMNYQAIGSGGGIRQTISGTVDFGGSDAAMTDAQISQVPSSRGGIILVPTAGGAVSVPYNLPGVSNLKLSRQALAGIFCGTITKWDDAKIKSANPGVSLPSLPIKVAVRADGSGTSFIFANHLVTVDSYCKGRLGAASTSPRWPRASLRGPQNAGVANLVKQNRGAIGYVEYAFAKQNRLTTAMVQNRKGQYIAPSEESANTALDGIKFPENFRVFDGDPDGGYPIVGLTWIMVYKRYPDAAKSSAIKKMVNWILTDGQALNGRLDYTRIPSSVAQRAISTVNSQVKP